MFRPTKKETKCIFMQLVQVNKAINRILNLTKSRLDYELGLLFQTLVLF